MVRVARGLLPVAAVLWAVAIVATPWSASLPGRSGPARLIAAATYLTGSIVCHQRPERSFHVGLVQWPVCARCTGLYLSAAAGVVFAWMSGLSRRPMAFDAWRPILLLAAIPTATTFLLEWWNPAWSSGLARAVAAVPLGAAAGVLLGASMSFRGRLGRCERMP